MPNSQSETLADPPPFRIGYRDTAGCKDTSKAELQLQRLEQAIRNSKGFFCALFHSVAQRCGRWAFLESGICTALQRIACFCSKNLTDRRIDRRKMSNAESLDLQPSAADPFAFLR